MDQPIEQLLEQHYEFFDRRIRQVLKVTGIRYDDGASYYNEIFFHVYQRVFNPACLGRYDAAQGSFRAWLGKVTRNAVLDWIKSAHSELPVSRGSEAQALSVRQERTASLDDMSPHEQDAAQHEALELGADIGLEDEDAAAAEARIGRALARMSAEHRAAFELYALAVRPVSPESRAAMGRWGGLDLASVAARLAALERRLADEAARGADRSMLALSEEMERLFYERLHKAQAALRAQGLAEAAIEALLDEAEGLTFGQIEARLKAAGRDARARAGLEAQRLFLRWRKWRGRLAAAEAELARAAAFPSYREMGELLGKPESAVAGLLFRAKKNFLKFLRDDEGVARKPRNVESGRSGAAAGRGAQD